MALLPYASRVTQTRGPKRDGERRGRERDRDLPAPDTEVADREDVELDEDYGTDVDEGTDEDLVAVESGDAGEEG
jgi:hypothetical protein